MRPLNLGETLDASIKIVGARWKTLAAVMLVIAVPVEIANVLIISSTTDVYQVGSSALSSTAQTKTTYTDSSAYAAGQVAMIALMILSYLLGNVACYRAIADTYLGRPTSARASLAYAGSRLGPALLLGILLFIGLVAAAIALILPAIWLAVAWSVAFPAMLVEGRGGAAALGRSFGLVSGRWWATAGRLIVSYLLVVVVGGIAGAVIGALSTTIVSDTSLGALILDRAGNLAVTLVTTPFAAAVTTLVYFDLRVRKEGFDLSLLAHRMGGDDALPAQPSAGRDAFGNPAAPSYAPPPAPAPAPPPPPSEPGASPGSGWAPPVAPQPPSTPPPPPSRPPAPDE